jgi:hypothetical protein
MNSVAKPALLPAYLLVEVQSAMAKAETYIRSRQSPEGGFCFYKSDYVDKPNLYDTYHAIAALSLLGAEVPSTDLVVQFVDRCWLLGLNYLYWYAFTLDCLGQASFDRQASTGAHT